MSLHFDTHEVEELAADFTAGPGRVQRGAQKVIDRSARRVQDAQRRDATGHRYLGELPGTVGRSRISELEQEVGFNKGGQGSLANILVFGSINNAPIMKSPAEHALRDLPHLTRDAEQMAEGAVLGDD